MQIQITHFDINNPQYQDCLAIRFEVLRKPLGMEITAEDRQKDADSTHILLQVDGQPAGTTSLCGNQLRQMAVLEKFQGQGLGAELVAHLEDIANCPEIILEARDYAIPFYEKLGYSGYGEFYEKVGMPHRMMKKPL